MNISPEKLQEMNQAFLEIQQARPNYVLENMIVNSRFTNQQQYAQCVLEMSIAYDNLRIAECNVKLKEIEIEELDTDNKKDQLNKRIKEVELEQTNRARLGALREFSYLYGLWKKFPTQYTREDLNNAQELEYKLRLETQAQQDLNATGRISQSNQEGLRQIGRLTFPQLDVSRDVERRFLEKGDIKILIAVATEHKSDNGLPCLEGLEMPNGCSVKTYNAWGKPVDENYNDIITTALRDKADYLITIEDDNFPPKDAIIRLLDLAKKNPKACIGGWYPKKEESRQGVHIELIDGVRGAMPDDGTIREAYTMAMGCSIYPIESLMSIQYPYCKTTANLSQDSFLSQLLRETGWRLLVDTSLKVGHRCRYTGKVYN